MGEKWVVVLSPYSRFAGQVGLVVGASRRPNCVRVQLGSSGPFCITGKYRDATPDEVARSQGRRLR